MKVDVYELCSMQGLKNYQEKLFNHFQLSERVPHENFYRKLKQALDFSFVRSITKEYYGAEGQKSIDPIVFFKLILVGYLENLNSDRKIISHDQTKYAKRMKRLRSCTVEPVLGTLINFTAMRRIWTRGIKKANKFMLGAAIAYNLKKYMNFKVKKASTKVQEISYGVNQDITLFTKLFLNDFKRPFFSIN